MFFYLSECTFLVETGCSKSHVNFPHRLNLHDKKAQFHAEIQLRYFS